VNGLSALSLRYSGSGNIASKADLGAYTYNQIKVNAVDNIVGDTLATVPSFQQLVSYTSFNKAHTIEDESNGYDYQIIYGPDNQRVKSILSDSMGWERTRYYFGSYEKDSTASGVKHTWYINSPYGLVAVYVKENTTETLYYAETDHLGSLVALRNTNGTVAESYSYDPWGRRRNPSNWSYSNVPEPVITNRGFTGHEHLEKFNLIDMNGRVYDPVTAGFLSPDIVVQAIDDSRAYNSYSYCYNNPLKAVDPSGYVMMMLPEYAGYSVASTNRALSQIEMRKSGEYSQLEIWRIENGLWDEMIDGPYWDSFWDSHGGKPQSGAQGLGVYNGQLVAKFTLDNTKQYLRGSYGTYNDVRPVVMSPTKGKTHYDCTGWLAYVLYNTYPSLLKSIAPGGMGPSSMVENYARLNGGIGSIPHVGDIAIWGGHVEIVVSVDGTVFQTNGSSGKGGSFIPTTKTFNGTGDTSLAWYGNGTFLGFWTPILP
jgi:RHS repeat-associated protein